MSNEPQPTPVREILVHKIKGDDSHVQVFADDRDPGCGNAAHNFLFLLPGQQDVSKAHDLRFQRGPLKVAGPNGVQDSAVIAVLIERFEGFQAGPFACETNARVLEHLKAALDLNSQRTRDRIARGVEGQNKA